MEGGRHELPGITVANIPPPPDEINLDAPPPRAPYGMDPNVRHVLPGITRLPPPTAPVDDESQYLDEHGNEYGISFKDPTTGQRITLRPNLENSEQVRAKKIHALGSALMDHAHTEAEKVAAERAAAWGLAQADTDVPIEHVIANMDASYRKDTGYEAALSKQTLANQGKLDAVHARFPWGTGTGGGTNLKQDKFDLQESQGYTSDLSGLVEAERKNYDFKANQATQQATQKMLAMMNSGNALAQRVAVMQELKELTGKQQTAREQAAIANAAGVMEAWMNDWALKIPGADPQLSESYRRKFIEALQIAQQTAQQTMADLGESGVNALKTAPFYQRMSPEERAMAEAHVRGRLSGKFDLPQENNGITFGQPKPKQAPKKYNIGDIVK
jgi:hypothetical protein